MAWSSLPACGSSPTAPGCRGACALSSLAEAFPWYLFPEVQCVGVFVVSLSPLLSCLAPPAASVFGCHGDVCPGFPFSPRRPCPPRWPCPQLAHCGAEGRVRAEGRHGPGWRPQTLCLDTVCQVARLRGRWRPSVARGGMRRKNSVLRSSGALTGSLQNRLGDEGGRALSPAREILFTL